jgi:hypothetical protein
MASQKRKLSAPGSTSRPRKRKKDPGAIYIPEELENHAAQKPTFVTAWNIETSTSASQSHNGKRRKARGSRMVVVVTEDPLPQAEEHFDDQQMMGPEIVTGEEEDAEFWETLEKDIPLAPKRKRKQRNDSVCSLKTSLVTYILRSRPD